MKPLTQQHVAGTLLRPHDIDAEQSVIGSILLDQDRLDDVLLALRAKDFYVDANRLIFETICKMADEGKRVDALLLHKRLEKLHVLDAVGGVSHITECADSVPTPGNAKYYAEIVHERALQRSLIEAAESILAMGYDVSKDPHESLAKAESEVFRILEDGTSAELPKLRDCVSKAADAIIARLEAGGGTDGLTTSYADLDAMTGGMRPGELVILAARPSMGKTALACNIAERLSMDAEHRVLFVSLEMPRLSLANRIVCSHARVDSQSAARGTISEADRERIIASVARLGSCEFYIDDMPGRMASEVAAQARRLKRKPGLDLVVVDYLQRLRPANPRDERERQVASMAQTLKNAALELGIPILCLAQLNRQVESSQEKRPNLGHLRESGAIEQEADQVWFVHRDDYFRSDNEKDGKAEIIVRKNRMGNTGTVDLHWFPERTRFESVAKQQSYSAPQHDRRMASANGSRFDPDQYERQEDGSYAAKDF